VISLWNFTIHEFQVRIMDTSLNTFFPTVAFDICRETQSLGQQMLNATVGKNGLSLGELWDNLYLEETIMRATSTNTHRDNSI